MATITIHLTTKEKTLLKKYLRERGYQNYKAFILNIVHSAMQTQPNRRTKK